jgi:fatty acid desaturase
LAFYKSVEAQLNHSVMHGAYVGLPGAERLTPSRYETLAIPFQSKTWGEAHRIHHAHASLLEDDPDTVHPLTRVHRDQPWRPWHLFNLVVGFVFTFECWAYDYDQFLKKRGRRSPRDRGELRKFLSYFAYHYVLFPALAGAHWRHVLLGNVAAAIIRNLIFVALQTGSSVGRSVSTRHDRAGLPRTRVAWLRFQVETSKNWVTTGIWKTLCGGLDRHIEHHLFPRLPPNRLHAISTEVREVCDGAGIEYQQFPSVWASLKDSASHLWRLSWPPRSQEPDQS